VSKHIATAAQHAQVEQEELKRFAFASEKKPRSPRPPVRQYVCAADKTPLTKEPCGEAHGLGHWRCPLCGGKKAKQV
jgi:hypothetical protein